MAGSAPSGRAVVARHDEHVARGREHGVAVRRVLALRSEHGPAPVRLQVDREQGALPGLPADADGVHGDGAVRRDGGVAEVLRLVVRLDLVVGVLEVAVDVHAHHPDEPVGAEAAHDQVVGPGDPRRPPGALAALRQRALVEQRPVALPADPHQPQLVARRTLARVDHRGPVRAEHGVELVRGAGRQRLRPHLAGGRVEPEDVEVLRAVAGGHQQLLVGKDDAGDGYVVVAELQDDHEGDHERDDHSGGAEHQRAVAAEPARGGLPERRPGRARDVPRRASRVRRRDRRARSRRCCRRANAGTAPAWPTRPGSRRATTCARC